MGERVQTGGTKTFDYSSISASKLGEDKKKEISDAYASYSERKKKEKIRKIALLVLILLVVISLSLFFIF